MKKLPILFFVLLAACNNASDGDAATNTTNFPVDTNLTNSADTADHLNSSTGTTSTDTSRKTGKDSASKATPPASRKTTPHDPAGIDTLRQ